MVNPTLNITTSSTSEAFNIIHDALKNEGVGPFVESLLGRLAKQTTSMGPGIQDFLGPLPFTAATLGPRKAEDVAARTWVEACNATITVMTRNEKGPYLAGGGNFVNMS